MSSPSSRKRRPKLALIGLAWETVRDVIRALSASRLGILTPLAILLLVLALFLVVFAAVPALTPFIYPIF